MAQSSGASADSFQQSILTMSETISALVEGVTSLPDTMESAIPSALAVANTTMDKQTAQTSWFGLFGRMVLFMIRVIPGILYYLITFSTITMPTFLFTLFSTSLTFTMNATTLSVSLFNSNSH